MNAGGRADAGGAGAACGARGVSTGGGAACGSGAGAGADDSTGADAGGVCSGDPPPHAEAVTAEETRSARSDCRVVMMVGHLYSK